MTKPINLTPVVRIMEYIRRSGNKWPKLRLATADGFGVVFGFNGRGQVTINESTRKGEGLWYGTISVGGQFDPTYKARQLPKERKLDLWALFLKLEEDVKVVLAAHGTEVGHCAICGHELSNDESVARGIGPECADKLAGFGG